MSIRGGCRLPYQFQRNASEPGVGDLRERAKRALPHVDARGSEGVSIPRRHERSRPSELLVAVRLAELETLLPVLSERPIYPPMTLVPLPLPARRHAVQEPYPGVRHHRECPAR